MTKQIVNRIAGLVLVAGVSGVGLWAGGDDPEQVKQLQDTRSCVACDFQDAKLMAVDVHGGNVSKSDFRGANLYKANLRGADLTGAQFGGANLSAADLRDAKGADLTGATTDGRTQCPGGTSGPCS